MPKPTSLPAAFLALLRGIALAISLGTACSSKPEEAEPKPDEEEATPKPVEVAADPATFPEIVAKVNGVEIEKATLLALASGREAQGSAQVRSLDFYRVALNELIGAELLFQASKDRNMVPGAEEVNQQIDSMRSRFPDPAGFEQALASEGLTLEKLRDQLQRNMSIQKLIEADIAPKIQVTEDAARKYYDENTEQMRQPDRLRVRHILKRVAPDATPESREAAHAALEKIREQAGSGSDFAALAREHSEDPGSAPNGGEMVIAPG
ncbi:MAG: peptidylprolyl isomerase, partial [Vicinamibacteria bacterium]